MPASAPPSTTIVLRSLKKLRKELKIAPTVRELADDTGLSVSAVHRALYQLRAAGRVAWDEGKPRTLRVVVRPRN